MDRDRRPRRTTGVNRRELLGAGAGALVLAADPWWLVRPAARREPIALTTADKEAHVVEIGLASGRVRRRLHTLEGPRSIESGAGGAVVVAHTAAGAISLLEGRPPRIR